MSKTYRLRTKRKSSKFLDGMRIFSKKSRRVLSFDNCTVREGNFEKRFVFSPYSKSKKEASLSRRFHQRRFRMANKQFLYNIMFYDEPYPIHRKTGGWLTR